MTSKERARIAMEGGTPDRVPVIPQICPPHAVRVAGLPYKDTIVGVLRNPREYDLLVGQCAASYGVDGFRTWIGGPVKNIEWDGEDAFETDPETGEKTGRVDFSGGGGAVVLKSKRRMLTEEDLEKEKVVPAEELLESEALVPTRKAVERFGDDMFVIGCPGAFTVEFMCHTQGMEPTLTDMIDRPDFIRRYSDKLTDAVIQKGLAMARAGVDALYIGETFGQFMSPDRFADLCVPYFRRFVEEVRPHGPLIYLHMCGRITHLLDLVLETGADGLEPLDIVAGTDAKEVRERIGDRMALMGGVNTVLLSRGSLEEVRHDCERCIRDAGQDGGYLLAACDMLPTETAPEKVKTMVECASTSGRYGG